MRTWVWSVFLASSTAFADDPTIRVRESTEGATEPATEPWLHLDAIAPDSVDAEGGIVRRRGVLFDLGPRAHLSAEGKWWQTGLAPSLFAEDLLVRGWRASAELSYDPGPFRLSVNASMGRVGDATHRTVGLFAYRTFHFSHWMHAWIVLGFALEQWDGSGPLPTGRSWTTGLMLGTTFH